MPRPECPVATRLATWAAWPDVLADPDQRGPHGVWTRREDVLTDPNLLTGRPLLVAWGESVWIATALWDPADPEVLWLQPLAPPTPLPDPQAVHAPDGWIQDTAQEVAQLMKSGDNADLVVAVLTDVLTRRAEAVLADFGATVTLLVELVRRNRHLAREVLADIRSRPGACGDGHPPAEWLAHLHRLARRPYPPAGG